MCNKRYANVIRCVVIFKIHIINFALDKGFIICYNVYIAVSGFWKSGLFLFYFADDGAIVSNH